MNPVGTKPGSQRQLLPASSSTIRRSAASSSRSSTLEEDLITSAEVSSISIFRPASPPARSRSKCVSPIGRAIRSARARSCSSRSRPIRRSISRHGSTFSARACNTSRPNSMNRLIVSWVSRPWLRRRSSCLRCAVRSAAPGALSNTSIASSVAWASTSAQKHTSTG